MALCPGADASAGTHEVIAVAAGLYQGLLIGSVCPAEEPQQDFHE